MSRRNGNGSRRANTANYGGPEWRGFADVMLSPSAKSAVEEAMTGDQSFLWDWLGSVVDSGYKFSLTYNPGVRSFIATLTGRDGSGPNVGYALSGFGVSPTVATLALWAKHELVCGGGSWVGDGDPDGPVQQELFR